MWAAGILVFYVLSTGPLMLMCEKGVISNKVAGWMFEFFYAPLVFVADKMPLDKPLGLYRHLWAPGMWDANGHDRFGAGS